jgi:hypothetical protein
VPAGPASTGTLANPGAPSSGGARGGGASR